MSKLVIVGTVAFDAIETPFGKTDKIRQWMESVIEKMDHYKAGYQGNYSTGTSSLGGQTR